MKGSVVLMAMISLVSLLVQETSAATSYQFPPNIHRCVWAGNKLRKAGDGSTAGKRVMYLKGAMPQHGQGVIGHRVLHYKALVLLYHPPHSQSHPNT